MTPKILLHNLTLKGIENVRGVLNYDQRALVLLDKGDLIITRNQIDPAYLDYLTSLGFNLEDVKCYTSRASIQTYDSIFYEPELVDFLKDCQGFELSTYNLTEFEYDFAVQNKLILSGNYKVAEKYGLKSYFRELCQELGLPVVFGFEKLSDVDLIIDYIKKINSKNVLIRLDEGVSGAGNFLLNKAEFLGKTNTDKVQIIKKILNALPQRQVNSGVTVETWIDEVVSSPSIQLYIHSDGKIDLLSTHDQILEGAEKWFIGSKYPSSSLDFINESVVLEAKKLGAYFYNQGFVGEFGLDLIITPETYYFVEANIRTLGTTYPREFVKKIRGGNLEGINYLAKDVEIKNFEKVTFEKIYDTLEQLKYNINSDSGILIYNTATIPIRGRFDIIIVGKSDLEINGLLREAQNLLSNKFGLQKNLL
jgi:hypothetical protein